MAAITYFFGGQFFGGSFFQSVFIQDTHDGGSRKKRDAEEEQYQKRYRENNEALHKNVLSSIQEVRNGNRTPAHKELLAIEMATSLATSLATDEEGDDIAVVFLLMH